MPRTLRTISPRAAKENVRALLASLPHNRPGSRADGGGTAINDSILIIPGGDVVVVDDNIFNQADIQDTARVCAYAYALNFTNNAGCIVVPAVEGLPSYLMYLENGNLTPDDINPSPQHKPTNFDYTFKLMTEWIQLKIQDDSNDEFTEGGGGTNYSPWVHDKQVAGNGIPVKWDQWPPFNDCCATINGIHPLVGCLAVAVGQVMAFHRYPTSYQGHPYDWNLMLATIYAPGVAQILADLGTQDNLRMSYGLSSSGASMKYVKPTFRNFGYISCNEPIDFSYPKLMADIKAGYPIILCAKNGLGECHAWVADGYYNRTCTRYSDNKKFKEEYVHCNWGWGGTYDGYVLANIFDYKGYTNDPFPDDYPPGNSDDPDISDTAFCKKIQIVTVLNHDKNQ